MATRTAAMEQGIDPVNGSIYRTFNDESLMVLNVREDRIFVEYADGRHGNVTWREWEKLKPSPAQC